MKPILSFTALIIALSACSETPIREQSEEEVVEIEKQIEADAKSLEEAADEAVKVLESEIEAELKSEGIGAPTEIPAETSSAE